MSECDIQPPKYPGAPLGRTGDLAMQSRGRGHGAEGSTAPGRSASGCGLALAPPVLASPRPVRGAPVRGPRYAAAMQGTYQIDQLADAHAPPIAERPCIRCEGACGAHAVEAEAVFERGLARCGAVGELVDV